MLPICYLYEQSHALHTSAVLTAGGDDIYACCIDTAMAKNIGELCNILFEPVKNPCKQVS